MSGPGAWCDVGAARPERSYGSGPRGGEGSFPDLGVTVRGTGSSPHESKGQQKYCSSPRVLHERAGVY